MEVSVGLVAGSHNANELVIIPRHGQVVQKRALEEEEEVDGDHREKVCKICGDDVGVTVDGELFVACDECAFPICTTCYDYERREGSQACPRCKTRFKRLKGFPRVEGDAEEEYDIDDIENEFNFVSQNKQHTQAIDQASPSLSPKSQNGQRIDHEYDLQPQEHAPVPSSARVQPRPMDPSKDLDAYGYGSVAWKDRMHIWKKKQEKLLLTRNENGSENWDLDPDNDETQLSLKDEARQPLSRKLRIPSSQINPYRMIIIIRLVILFFFFHYRVTHPVKDAYALWLISVICEIWFALYWIIDQLPRWTPIERETYLDRLSLRYEKEGQPCQLSPIDILVTTVDPLKEPPLVTANTVLSILAVDYPVDKVSCYVSDDGASMLTFEVLSETSEFARKWVPFCKKYDIEPRGPEWYFSENIDYLNRMVLPSFVKERRAMKRDYEEFKVRINALVAKAKKVPEGGWTMQDGTLWPGDNVQDHPGMIQVFLGHSREHGMGGNELPSFVYVSREKRFGFDHHKKAGAMNALVRVSAVLSNAPYLLNLNYDHYISNSKALREAMCFMMDPLLGKGVCYVQFPQRFCHIEKNATYTSQNTIFFDVNMKCLDGIQGPIYVGTGCVFRRQALYGYDAPRKKKPPTRTCNCWPKCCYGMCCSGKRRKKKAKHLKPWMKRINPTKADESTKVSALEAADEGNEEGESTALIPEQKLENRFGQSPVFVASTLLEDGGTVKNASPASLLKEAIHVLSCSYEERTEWGKEVGWIYGSVRGDILTGFKMHCHGWRSIYCVPSSPAFKGFAPINLSNHLHQVLTWALGSIEIFLSKHCPLWYGYGGGLKRSQRLSYVNAAVYPLVSIPLIAYCTIPAVCLLTGKFIIPELSNVASMWFMSLFICIIATSILEIKWSGVGIEEWWRNEQFWVIGGVSAHIFAVFQGLFQVLTGLDTSFAITSKAGDDKELSKLYKLKWTILLIPPTTLLIINLIGMVIGISHAILNGYESWGPLFGKLFFSFWVISHLYPFLKGLLGTQNRTPTIIVVWSVMVASIFSLLWVRIDPFVGKSDGPILEECGLDCN